MAETVFSSIKRTFGEYITAINPSGLSLLKNTENRLKDIS
jgi:hypothetical protein